ncbi:hypothetical protein Adt_42055 [Abeliophyllum distichum]|uniref:Uncharacterized protein n=1 Tax=Abeliophyllum distichum TaxID=126358 RepID=A0ABD1PQK6_9LAMI
MLNENIFTTILNPVPPMSTSPQSTKKKSIGKAKASVSPYKEEPSQSQFQDSKNQWSYYFDPYDPKNLEKLEQQFEEDKHKMKNMSWWKQARLPSDSDNLDELAMMTNLDNP